MSNNFFISCEEATEICNKNQYKEASLWEKVRLRIHLFICKKCGQYSKQNTILTQVCEKHLQCDSEEHKLTEHDKEVLQHKIEDKINH